MEQSRRPSVEPSPQLERPLAGVSAVFRRTVAFGVLPATGEHGDSGVIVYAKLLGEVRAKIVQALDDNPDATVDVARNDLQEALHLTEALLEPYDDVARRALLPLLQRPLNVGGKLQLSKVP